jgi:ArsR family transcriptional regulator
MHNNIFSKEKLERIAQWLKIFSEPNRLLLLEKIIDGVQCNCELGDSLQMAPNLISHHLSVLRDAGIIEAERDPVDARWIYYSINTEVMDELRQNIDDFLNSSRVQPRKLTCGPQTTEEQRLSFMRMVKK